MLKREQLEQEKARLTARLKEVTTALDELNNEIFRGKFRKAMKLLHECMPVMQGETTEFECYCNECEQDVYCEVEFGDICHQLEMMGDVLE